MKKIIVVGCISASALMAETPEIKLLTGDAKLACEAKMCLTVPNDRPAECSEAIHRYLSISHKSASETQRKREEFLNKCPMQ